MRTSRSALLPMLAAAAMLAGCSATIVEPTLPPAWTAADAARPLTHADCVRLAAQSAPHAAAWEARRLAAHADLDQASLLANPTLSLGWEDFGINHAAEGSAVQTTLSLAVALEDVFSRQRREAAASHELDAEEADLRAEHARLAAEVTSAYDALVAARARVALHEELAAQAGAQRGDVAKFVAAGSAARIEQERADAEQAQAEADLARSRTEARALELEFAFALGFERPLSLPLADAMTGAMPGAMPGPMPGAEAVDARDDLAALLATAARARPELAAASARYAAQRERLSLAAERPQFLPTLSAGPRTQDGELRGVAGIDVALPLFDSGAAAERGQQAALLAAAADLRAAAHGVAREVSTAHERLAAAQAYLADHARDLADRRHALRERTETLFRAGDTDYTDVALARRDEVEARLALLDAQLAVAAARVELDAAIGALEPAAVLLPSDSGPGDRP